MKALNTLIASTMLLTSLTAAQAASSNAVMVCIHDQTPWDGLYLEMELVRNDNGDFNVVMHSDNPWTPEGIETRTYAVALRCGFYATNPLLAYCWRNPNMRGELRSEFTTTAMESIFMDDDGKVYPNKSLKVDVRSPELGDDGFSHEFPLSGCRTM